MHYIRLYGLVQILMLRVKRFAFHLRETQRHGGSGKDSYPFTEPINTLIND